MDIIDLEKTVPQLEAAASFLAETAGAGKTVLFVGVKPEARNAVEEVAQTLKMPYVTERWIGGILTNFPQMKKRIEKLEQLKEERTGGGFDKYTKKEQAVLNRELDRLNKYFSGLVGLTRLPDALVVVDSKKEHTAVAEAKKMRIPVVALGNTDCSIFGITYPIVANDSSASSIKAILGILKESLSK